MSTEVLNQMSLNKDQISRLINLGYELKIYDVNSNYPGGLDRGQWVESEILLICWPGAEEIAKTIGDELA